MLVIQALEDGPVGQQELRRAAGSPASSTLRNQLARLEASGVTTKHKQDAFPGALEFELSDRGRQLLVVVAHLEGWLATAPGGPLSLGEGPARSAIKGLVDSWSTTVLDALADCSLSLTELDKRISAASYPTIERCLDTLKIAELVDVSARKRSGTPFAITDWLRRGLGPLIVAARWEHRHEVDDAEAVCAGDVEAAVALAAPLTQPGNPLGTCQLAVRSAGDPKRRGALVTLEFNAATPAIATVLPQTKPDAWASGTAETWFAMLVDSDARGLRLSGDRTLALSLIESLHLAVF